MKISYFLLLFSTMFFAQNQPLELKIDSITSIDSLSSLRKFQVNYHIENLTNQEISFFLNPKNVIPNASASMQAAVAYRIFENNEEIDNENIFVDNKMELLYARLKAAKTEEEKKEIIEEHFKSFRLDVKEELKKRDKNKNYNWDNENRLLLSNLLILKPNEKLNFTKEFRRNKQRYYKIDDNEYYIDEVKQHFIELSITLLKDEFKEKLTKDEFDQIMKNKNFIKGWFKSNKGEINFKE